MVVCCCVYISATQCRAACNNQSETSVADACAAVCKHPSLTLYQPVAKVRPISALPRAIFFRADTGRSYDNARNIFLLTECKMAAWLRFLISSVPNVAKRSRPIWHQCKYTVTTDDRPTDLQWWAKVNLKRVNF